MPSELLVRSLQSQGQREACSYFPLSPIFPPLGKKKSIFQDLITINLILGWCLTGGDA